MSYTQFLTSAQIPADILTGSKDTPAATSVAYQRMLHKWILIRDLLGGTARMRAAARRWLPQFVRETDKAYWNRLNTSYLYEALKDTIEKITARPFSKPVSVSDTGNEQLELIQTDADFEKQGLTPFAETVFELGIAYGLSYIFVDYPNVGSVTLDTQRKERLHPYFNLVHPMDLLGAKVTQERGVTKLDQIRIRRTVIVEDGSWGEEEKDEILVWNADGTWETYREENGDWNSADSGVHSYPGIPLAIFYAQKKSVLEAVPPLEALAWLNLAHWQSYSDQRNILRVARVPILHRTGVTAEEAGKPLTVGPNNVIQTRSVDARMEYVEHSGKAITAGKEELDELEDWMETLGLQPFMEGSARTATEVGSRENRKMTSVQSWVRGMESTLREAYEIAARWIKATLPEDFSVDIFSDFSVATQSTTDLKSLDAARARGDLTLETFLSEQKRRGVLADSVDPAEEAEAALNENDFTQPDTF